MGMPLMLLICIKLAASVTVALGESVRTLDLIASLTCILFRKWIGIFITVRRGFSRGKHLAVIHRIVADNNVGQSNGNHSWGE